MDKQGHPQRGDVYWVTLDPTVGAEINKTRPAVIISNNAINTASRRVIVAPITSSATNIYPFEAQVVINGKVGKVLLDQVRSVDKRRLSTKMASLNEKTMSHVDEALKIALEIS